jgi:gamma-glutamyltranspeptidase / glutathione hydrolase
MRCKLAVLIACCALSSIAQRKDMERPIGQPARGTRGAVAGGSDLTFEAGLRTFHRGGNAVDAGVASMFAGSMVEFSHFGFGGEAPILIRTKDGKVHAIAGVGTMPKIATADFFRNRRIMQGEILALEPGGLKGIIPVAGLMPALVPGMVEAGLVALREYGTMSFADVIQPAIELADGAPIDELRSIYISRSRRFLDIWPASKHVFMPDGRAPMPGDIFRQPDLARTLRTMVEAEKQALKKGASRTAAIDAVRDCFYRGEIAKRIDAFSRANNGLLRYEDMAAFRLKPEDPVSTTYRGYDVYKPGFWSQGPVFIEELNMLEGFDLRAMGFNSPNYIHTLTEAMKLAFADRDTYYGDPAFNQIPAARLLSKEYGAERRKQIGEKASSTFRPGSINGKIGKHPSEMEMARYRIDDELMASDTTCVDVVDKDGIMFSATPSGAWMPSVIAGDTGIPLTERAQSFLLLPGHPNELAGGKRPRVTLSPTIVTKDGKPFLALSTPGGDNQDQALLELMLNIIEFGMNAEQSVEAPRFETRHLVSSFDNHAMDPGSLYLDERIPGAPYTDLNERGHRIGILSKWSSGSRPVIIRVLPDGVMETGADPYGGRVAVAW